MGLCEAMLGKSSSVVARAKKMAKPDKVSEPRTVTIPKTKNQSRTSVADVSNRSWT